MQELDRAILKFAYKIEKDEARGVTANELFQLPEVNQLAPTDTNHKWSDELCACLHRLEKQGFIWKSELTLRFGAGGDWFVVAGHKPTITITCLGKSRAEITPLDRS